ncbi:hypothetical protein ABBQ38_002364 [Trebouxia sp. C0009 RCD-2024]
MFSAKLLTTHWQTPCLGSLAKQYAAVKHTAVLPTYESVLDGAEVTVAQGSKHHYTHHTQLVPQEVFWLHDGQVNVYVALRLPTLSTSLATSPRRASHITPCFLLR